MKPSISTPYQRHRLAEFSRLAAERHDRAQAIEADYLQTRDQLQSGYEQRRRQTDLSHQTAFSALQGAYLQRLEAARTRFESDSDQLESQKHASHEAAEKILCESRHDGELNWEQTRAIALQNHDTDQQHSQEATERSLAAVASCHQQFQWLQQRVRRMLQRRGAHANHVDIPHSDPEVTTAELIKDYSYAAQAANDLLRGLSSRPVCRFVDDGWPVLLFLFVSAAMGIPLGIAANWNGWQWLLLAGLSATAVSLAARYLGEFWIRRTCAAEIEQIAHAARTAEIALAHADEMIPIESRRRERELEKRKNRQLRQADETWQTILSDLKAEHTAAVSQSDQVYRQQLRAVQRTWDVEAASCREKYVPRIEKSQADHSDHLAALEADHDQRLRDLEDVRVRQWDSLTQTWHVGARALANDARSMTDYCQEHFRSWDLVELDQEHSTARDVPALPFGRYRVKLEALPHGVPDDPRLQIDWHSLDWPSVLAFPDAPSLLIETESEGRLPAIGLLQTCMLRMLTSFPPGKVRFTIFDPTGLGENFSTFMHLSDYDERLVNNRIWTESSHIHQRLTDLTEHMENVIQKYLRNEFQSIQEYNQRAGEIAEPFQILVVANFPVNFSEEAARRLISIASSGARCGVYFFISVDRRQKMPASFDLSDLAAAANAIEWRDGAFWWKYEDLARFPLTIDPAASSEQATRIVKETGRRAKDANRVEVPFTAVTPIDPDWWQADSRTEINVPLGRAGATQLQYLSLGLGTSQHVLVAGKTGSGKSTLLNAVITNLALHYAPEQLQFFLVDFKKGVEFKAYAEYQLPHARVIAIESEREFGMSVLERLDAELHERGELFRDVNVQNLAAFRESRPHVAMPRLLLIIDEFQEFFVKDDKIAQEAALLLDRLVRQGRAFGIHVLLGSQTLAGAYSLARSTLGQMAVRIALQCSESDAHLILSEENTAARLLNRPGEAIYNNANGRFEGNHPFQVVWLPDDQREFYLRKLATYASDRGVQHDRPIVFEGNVAANLVENQSLIKAWRCPPTDRDRVITRAWLGAPVAIKEPTHVVLRRQTGSHILVVGQQEAMALGVIASSIVGLAASQPWRSEANGDTPTRAARFLLCDGGTTDVDAVPLRRRSERWPMIEVTAIDNARVSAAMSELADELTRRLADPNTFRTAEPIFLVVFNLGRFRDLRAADDDFGLGSFSDGPATSPSQIFSQLLREGASVGMHCVLWCDSYNNLTRWISRQTLRDIAFRVLFQMSAGDSSNLMDSAAASHLGANRAILYDDERGASERFRPYDPDLVGVWDKLGIS